MQHGVHLHVGKDIARPENVDSGYIMHSRPCLILEVLLYLVFVPNPNIPYALLYFVLKHAFRRTVPGNIFVSPTLLLL